MSSLPDSMGRGGGLIVRLVRHEEEGLESHLLGRRPRVIRRVRRQERQLRQELRGRGPSTMGHLGR